MKFISDTLDFLRSLFLLKYRLGWQLALYLVRAVDAATGHQVVNDFMERWDTGRLVQQGLRLCRAVAQPPDPAIAGGVQLTHPHILAAGWVKGTGFDNEVQALAAVVQGRNLIPGWRSLPSLVGPVEFGSYTRWPRHGNRGATMWRLPGRSLGNRVGLRNVGIRAASSFLSMHQEELPRCWGINLAPTPGVEDPQQLFEEMQQSLAYLVDAALKPSWVTINISCPTTNADMESVQSEAQVRALLMAARQGLPRDVPLWIKVGPGLPASRYAMLVALCGEFRVRAVVATNTRQEVDGDGRSWGASGETLARDSLDAVVKLTVLKQMLNVPVDIIACGGILQGRDLRQLRRFGIVVWQYFAALVYRGPFAGGLISRESMHQS